MPSFRITLGLLVTGLLLLIAFAIAVPRDAATDAYDHGPASLLAKNTAGRTPDASPQPRGSGGFGVLGDSNSDEYRADNDRGSEPWKETTLNFVELLARHRGLDFGLWGTRPEPRRTGYAYNWSRSGATAATLISRGQHTGLAAQIRQEEVEHVFFRIGANDFAPFGYVSNGYVAIYSGELQGEALQNRLDEFIGNVRTAIDTLAAADPTDIVLANILDYNLYPLIVEAFPDPVGRQRFTDAIDYVNEGLSEIADSHDTAVLASHDTWIQPLIDAYPSDFIEVAGVQINVVVPSDAPTSFVLGDGIHLGTVAQGMVANEIFLRPFNEAWGLGIEPFSEEELIANAGLVAPVDSESNAPEHLLELQSYPNPAFEALTIEFILPNAGFVSLKVFDLKGREVATLVADDLSAGSHTIETDVSDWGAGTYVYQLKNGRLSGSAQFTVVR